MADSTSFIHDKLSDKTSGRDAGQKILSNELCDIFTIEEIKSEVDFWKKFKYCFKAQSSQTPRVSAFNKICGLCLGTPKDQRQLLKFRISGLYRLNLYFSNSTRKDIQSKDIKLLTWCCLSLISFFYSKEQEDHCFCVKANKRNQSKEVFRTALYLTMPEKQDEVIKSTIRYITLTSQWNSEDYDSYVFQELITVISKPEILVAKIIKQIETSQRDEFITEAFNISCTLSSILERTCWNKYLFNHLLHNCFNTLLKVFLLCNVPLKSTTRIENAKFRIVIKTCIKYFITNIKDNKGLVSVLDSLAKCLHDPTIKDDDRIEIMELIAFTSQKHQTKHYRETITPDLLNLLLNSLFSTDKVLVLTTHKIFHQLLDRHDNEKNFNEPVYYFNGKSNLKINYDCSVEDAHFVKSFSENFLEGIHHSFLTFTEKYSLVTFYATVCIVLVEIPEPVITINIIRSLINIQNSTISNKKLSLTEKSHIHATISSIFTLICSIHVGEVVPLKKYVDEVVQFRTENSPHLLPPLQNKYSLASHHTTDYYAQLYFVEEELLYALQRCWLAKRVQGSK